MQLFARKYKAFLQLFAMGVNGNGFLTKMDLKKGPPEYFEGVLAEVGEDIARPARDDGSAACRGF